MTFPATWQEFQDYVQQLSGPPNSDGAKIEFTHDGQGNSAEPWYIAHITREEITPDGRGFTRSSFQTDVQFSSARVGSYNEVEVVAANECRLRPASVRAACKALNIPAPDADLQPRIIASSDPISGDRREETIDPDTGDTTLVEYFDGTTEALVQRETVSGGEVKLLETFDKDTGEALKSVVDPEPGEGR